MEWRVCLNTKPERCIAHTISQRIRTLKKIPPELIPLGESSSASSIVQISCANRQMQVSSLGMYHTVRQQQRSLSDIANLALPSSRLFTPSLASFIPMALYVCTDREDTTKPLRQSTQSHKQKHEDEIEENIVGGAGKQIAKPVQSIYHPISSFIR